MDYKLIGAPCGQHGPYTFYKALKYTKDGKTNILALSEFFFVKLWTDSDLISIGELQLLWEDKNSDQTLASLRLYILPENTPDGRTDLHGEDEVLAITEKVVIRVEDLMTWITQATDWHWGLNAIWGKSSPSSITPPYTFAIDMEDIKKEKEALDSSLWETHVGVVVLSYPRYCRYRGVVKRLQGVEEDWIKTSMVLALGGFTCPWKNTRILFCKETFDYPELEGHELLCNHLAPKLKGRPRKRKRTNQSPTESETESESSQSTASSTTSKTKGSPSKAVASTSKPKLRCSPDVAKRPARGPTPEEKNFMSALQNFMKERKTPISRIPIVGFKEVSLFKLYKKVGELGGYDAVTAGKLWKYVYEVMGGDMTSTSAATLSRRHYEKLLLPYERHLNGTKIQPKSKSSLSHPAGSNPSSNQTNSGSKESKSSSLRNIRLKQEKGAGNGKENIPQQKVEVGGKSIKTEPEIINLSSNEPPTIKTESGKRVPIIPTSVPSALSPLMKKQKLDILKEGGLEVTPVGGGPGGSGAGGRASVIKVPMVPQPPRLPPPVGQPMSKYRDSKVSITVTPDMSTLLGPTALLAGPSSSSSKRPVYGNPKVFNPPPPSQSGEILDLRTKPRINIGSSLEITLVPSTRPPPSPVVQMRGPPIGLPPQQVRPSPLAKPPLPPSKPPPKPQAKPNPQVKTQPQVHPYPYYKPAYMPVLDHRQIGTNSFLSNQVYLSALYNNLYRPYSPQQMPQIATNVYKELLRRQGVFPSIDGSTSITLVSQTPTSK